MKQRWEEQKKEKEKRQKEYVFSWTSLKGSYSSLSLFQHFVKRLESRGVRGKANILQVCQVDYRGMGGFRSKPAFCGAKKEKRNKKGGETRYTHLVQDASHDTG